MTQKLSEIFWPNASIIFETPDEYHDNAFRKWARQEKIEYREVLGKYRGHFNRAFMIPFHEKGRVYPWWVSQESIFVMQSLGDSYECWLEFMDGSPMLPLGHLKEVPSTEVKRYEGATLEPISGKWFITSRTRRLHRPPDNVPTHIVGLFNEDNVLTVWPVFADSDDEAMQEAWADFRELHTRWDGEMPPDWTHAHFIYKAKP